MKYLRYYSEFKSLDGATYRIELMQEAESAYTPEEVTLADDGITIEWGEVKKIDPVMSSSATLRLMSMSDRQFIDLYTVEPKAIRLDVYRDSSLYWSGTIDTELFEEPYSQLTRYVTEVTFSDFAVLDRLTWENTGMATVGEVINTCLSASGVSYASIEKYISTSIPDSTADIFDGCSLSLENFYDEDGEAWTIREVLDEVLRPFALQLRQKNGRVVIYDTNALASLTPQEVEWRAADSRLGVEPTYNKVELTFSPYATAELYDGSFDEEKIMPDKNASDVTSLRVMIPDAETGITGFYLYYDAARSTMEQIQRLSVGNNARLFEISPENDGEESVGVMWGVRPYSDDWSGQAPRSLILAAPFIEGAFLQSEPFYVQPSVASDRLKISLDVLYDPRKNPFEVESANNGVDEWKTFKSMAVFGGVPCMLVVNGVDGSTWTYDNSALWTALYGDEGSFYEKYENNRGSWVSGRSGVLWLSYYDQGDRKKTSAFTGWATNKQSIGCWTGDLPKFITLNIDGEKISLPPVAGTATLYVFTGIITFAKGGVTSTPNQTAVPTAARWLLYKNPRISITSFYGKEKDVEDITYSAWINKAAEEELPVDTYIGTPTNRTPLARGSLLLSNGYAPISAFRRAEMTDKAEKLLIGSIYSNYATRHSTLRGTIKLIPEFTIVSDKSAVNGRYVLLSATENLAQGTSEVKMAEISADSYEGIEYE